MNCSTPGFPVHHQLMELAQIQDVGLVLRRRGLAAPLAPSEDITDVEIHAQLALEEVAAGAEVDAVLGLAEAEETQARRAVVAVGEELHLVPHLGPEVDTEAVAEFVVDILCAVVVVAVAVVEQRGVEPDTRQLSRATPARSSA